MARLSIETSSVEAERLATNATAGTNKNIFFMRIPSLKNTRMYTTGHQPSYFGAKRQYRQPELIVLCVLIYFSDLLTFCHCLQPMSSIDTTQYHAHSYPEKALLAELPQLHHQSPSPSQPMLSIAT